jgi:hypothetical protein
MAATMGDVHPPLYYLLLYPIVHWFGPSVWAARLPSLVFSLLAIWLVGRLADQLGLSSRARWVAMILMAILPGELLYAQEARMYALLQALVLGWVLATLRRQWALAGLLGALTLYTHNYGLFYLAAIGLLGFAGELYRPVILDPGSDRWKPGDECQLSGAVLAAVLPFCLYLPWQLVLFGQMATVASGYWIPPINIGGVFYGIYLLFFSIYGPPDENALAALCLFVALISAIVVGWRLPGRKTLVFLSAAPLALAVLASLMWRPILLFRGLIPILPFMVLLIASAAASLSPTRLVLVGALASPILLPGSWFYYQQARFDKGNIYQQAAAVRANWQPGDLIYHANDGSTPQWLLAAPDLPQASMPDCFGEHNGAALSPATRQALGFNMLEPDQLRGRIWVIWANGPTTLGCEARQASELIGETEPFFKIRNDQFWASNIFLVVR